MPNALMVGQLRTQDASGITLSGNVRLALAPGVVVPKLHIGRSVIVRVAWRDGVLYAENVRETPAAFE